MSITSDLAQEPGYFTRYQNFALSRSASGVLTLRFHTGGWPHTFDGTTHHDLPRLLEDIAFDPGRSWWTRRTRSASPLTASPTGPSLTASPKDHWPRTQPQSSRRHSGMLRARIRAGP